MIPGPVAESRARRGLLDRRTRTYRRTSVSTPCTALTGHKRRRGASARAPSNDVRYVMHRHERLERPTRVPRAIVTDTGRIVQLACARV